MLHTTTSLLDRPVWQTLGKTVARLRRDIMALYYAARDPATPWYAKAVVACIVAYALSPIDLIPDFIPVLGWLDELILLPLALALAIRLIPPPVMAAARARAAVESSSPRPRSLLGAAFIVALWLAALALTIWMIRHAG